MADSVTAKLKFNDRMPYKLEQRLTKDLGFTFLARKFGEYVIYEKLKPDPLKIEVTPDQTTLTPNEKILLMRHCNAIKATFHDPKDSAELIRFRIRASVKTQSIAHQQWADGWIERNIDIL